MIDGRITQMVKRPTFSVKEPMRHGPLGKTNAFEFKFFRNPEQNQIKEELIMLCETRFFRCDICGNLVGMIHASGAPMSCCGQHMTELIPGSVDASQEKHVPVIKVEGDKATVHVGSVDHPMLEEHHIAWIYLRTTDGGQRKCLEVGGKPEATFALGGAKVVAAYEYCNLHGLWKADA